MEIIFMFMFTVVTVDGENWYSAEINKNSLKTLFETNHTVQQQLQNADQIKSSTKETFFSLHSKRIKNKTSVNLSIKRMASNENHKNKERFLNVFQMVQFEHISCTSHNGLDGTCLPEHECKTTGGTNLGSCADGYGICCVNLFLCDGNSAAETGWFTNPEFPSPSSERISCVSALVRSSEDIKQIRLDFFNFELLPPLGGICDEDQFVISGQNVNHFIPILCGINTGQHLYIQVDESDGPIFLSMQTNSPDSRLFSIKVTQVKVSDNLAAPTSCLQYFKEAEGSFESFNYRDESKIAIPTRPSYLNNLNYAICIRRDLGTCSITYTNGGDIQIVNYDTDGLPVIPPYQAGVEIFNCPSDWLLISATRLCGERLNDGSVLQDFSLNAPVTDTNAGPIVIWFRTNEGYTGRGFRLRYKQNLCT